MTLTVPPVTAALAAVERALAEAEVVAIRHSPSSALHRLEYDHDGDVLAAVGWGSGLMFFDDLEDELRALITAHAHLASVSRDADPTDH